MKNVNLGQTIPVIAYVGVIAAGLASPRVIGQINQSVCADNTPAVFHRCALDAAQAFDPPRTPDGRPDMGGIWHLPGGQGGGTYEDLEEHPETFDDSGGPSTVVDPPDGKVPMHEWANVIRQEHPQRYIHPHTACFLPGVPHSTYNGGARQFLQTPNYLVILGGDTHYYRIIPLDGHPPVGESITLWNGDSRGRWEGNTLVIETTNQNGKTWLDQRGRFYTEEAHVIERLTLIDADTMHYQATLSDPNVYTRPFTLAFPYRRNAAEGSELRESACYENNQGLMEVYRGLGFALYPGISPDEAREAIDAEQ